MPDYMYKRRACSYIGPDLVSVIATDNARGMIMLWNWRQSREMTMAIRDYKKMRKKAYKYAEVAKLVGYKVDSLRVLSSIGRIPKPDGRSAGHKNGLGIPAYYTEDAVYEIRSALAEYHRGHPRKDGIKINNLVPSEAELSARINNTELVYRKTEDGRFIPTFPETI